MPVFRAEDTRIVRGDTFLESFQIGVSVGVSDNVVFLVKLSKADADSEAVLQVDSDNGLLLVNGASAADPALAAVTVVSVVGTVDVTIDPSITAQLESGYGHCYFDFRIVKP